MTKQSIQKGRGKPSPGSHNVAPHPFAEGIPLRPLIAIEYEAPFKELQPITKGYVVFYIIQNVSVCDGKQEHF